MFESINNAFDSLMGLMQNWPAWVSCALLSAVIGIVLLPVFKVISPQRRIEVVKDKMMACILGVWLFRDQPRMIARCQGGATVHGFHYFGLSILPLLVLAMPMCLVLYQMNAYFTYRPLSAGDVAHVRLTYAGADPPRAQLVLPAGLRAEAEHFDANQREHVWRVVAVQPNDPAITTTATAGQSAGSAMSFIVGGQEVRTQVALGDSVIRTEPVHTHLGFWDRLAFWEDPSQEPPLPSAGPIASIHVTYPERDWWLGWWWLDSFLFMLIAILIARKPLGVAI